MVGANWDFVDSDDNLLFSEMMLSLPQVMHPPQTFYKQLFANRVHSAAHTFRRSVWKKTGGFPEHIELWGDWAFWIQATPHGDFVHMRRTIARYRINYRPGLALARMDQSLRDEVAVRLELIPRIARQLPNVEQAKVQRASRRRFRHVLHHTSKVLAGLDRTEQSVILEPWARSLGPGALKLLDRFGRGGSIGLGWIDGIVVGWSRHFYKRIQQSSTPRRKEAGETKRAQVGYRADDHWP